MENGIKGGFTASGDQHLPSFISEIKYQEQYDKTANTSVLGLTADLATDQWTGLGYTVNIDVMADGRSIGAFSGAVRLSNTKGEPVEITGGPWTTEAIRHSSDGTASINLVVVISGSRTDPQAIQAKQFRLTGSQQIQLTKLPASAVLMAQDADIERVCQLSIQKASPADTVSIRYEFGSLTGYIGQDGGTSTAEKKLSAVSIPWLVPAAFYQEIPAAPSGVCTFTVTTYRADGTDVPQTVSSCTIRAAPDLCGPSVAGSVTDENPVIISLTGNAETLVLSASTASCVIQAQAKKGARIVSKSVSGQMFGDSDTLAIPAVRISTFDFVAVDSRGYSARQQITPQVVPYIPLTCNPAIRHDGAEGNGQLTVTGGYYNGSFGAENNQPLFLMWKVSGSQQPAVRFDPAPGDISDGKYTATTQISGLDYRKKTTVYVTAYDRVHPDGITVAVVVPPAIPLFDWGEKDFRFHVPVELGAGLVGITEDTENPGSWYHTADRTREWMNPPMVTDETYRTTERFLGEPVRTTIRYGLIVPGGVASVPLPSGRIIRYAGYVGDNKAIPLMPGADPATWVTAAVGSGSAKVYAGANVPEWGFYLQVWYIKNTALTAQEVRQNETYRK